jgi:hypothetical protein
MLHYPQQCLFAAKLLESEPLFNGSGSLVKTCKVIPLESWDDTRIFDIFNKNAAKFTGKKSAWRIHQFGCGNNQLMDAKGKYIQQGLNLWLYAELERCSIETLEQAYSHVYDAMRKGWVEASPEEYQNIMFKEDSKKFALFVKKGEISEEDTLIRFLTSKFGLEGQVKCHSEWLKEGAGYCYNDNIYMWINKEELSKIIEKFGFEV